MMKRPVLWDNNQMAEIIGAGASEPKCLVCSRTYSEHTWESRDVCNCYIESSPKIETYRRCGICGFIVDVKFEATKPTVQYGSAGRAKTKPDTDKLAELQAWLDERGRNSTSYGSHAHAYEVAARKLREATT
jgi:hypothetical protein